MIYRDRCDANVERKQQRQAAGLISKRFPEVSSIVIEMQHHKSGIREMLIARTLNFSSESHAYFHIECLNRDCSDCSEGFDLDQVVTSMVRCRAVLRDGQLDCKGRGLTSGHVNISYKIMVRYNEI